MKRLLFFIAIFCVLKLDAQDYLIAFVGTGLSTDVNTVKVENLTAGTSLNINGNDILHLTTILTEVNTVRNIQHPEIKIYPNPVTDNSTLEFYPQEAGDATISVYDINGNLAARIHAFLDNCRQDFRLSGFEKGFYIITVKSENYKFSAKLLSIANTGGAIDIEKINNSVQEFEKAEKTESKGTLTTVDMIYTNGDRLKFTGISGIFSTVITDIPSSDKSLLFNFIACTDGDNNNYPVVKIGDQVWMAENLKATKYIDNTSMSFVNTPSAWSSIQTDTKAFGWYADNPANKNIHGALYTWAAAMNGAVSSNPNPSGVQGACPAGWHLPGDAEWSTLTDYLTDNGYGYQGNGTFIAKSLAANTNWLVGLAEGDPGIDKAGNNSTGFSALPSGYHSDPYMFHYIDSRSYFWSSTQHETIADYAYNRNLGHDYNYVGRSAYNKKNGVSIRCLKDN